MTHLDMPILGAKWAIGSLALFHTIVASLGIGFAFFVTVAQVVGYLRKDRGLDLLAKRIQLVHVCIYNIGTINAIGLVFVLSGLYPQFWGQIFNQFCWPVIVEEFIFFLLATTLTLHYFFWDHLWGHKKTHIFLGALLTPLFFLQFYIINGLGGFMLTPGAGPGDIDLGLGVLGWDRMGFYNPSFLMLTVHRTLANVAYGAFGAAAICGVMLYFARRERVQGFYRNGGRLAFYVGFTAFLSLPIAGYFYAHVLQNHASEAFVNLMWGRGDVAAGGIDWWWVKHVLVAGMLGICLSYYRLSDKEQKPFTLPAVAVYAVALFYVVFYLAMGMIMTWAFFWYMFGTAVFGYLLGRHMWRFHNGSPQAVFLMIGILSFCTVLLGGYVREASRPRFVNRIAAYDEAYVPQHRGPYLMVEVDPATLPKVEKKAPVSKPAALIRIKCSGCHTLQRVRGYNYADWTTIVRQMEAYGLNLTRYEQRTIIELLDSGKPY